MAQHTQGPWGCTYTSNYAHDYRLTQPNGAPLPLHVEANDHSVQRANARLIASSPDLLDALQKLIPHVMHYASIPSSHSDAHKDVAAARAVIAKATGSAS